MALKISGTPHPISVIGDLHEVSEGPRAKAALKAAREHKQEDRGQSADTREHAHAGGHAD